MMAEPYTSSLPHRCVERSALELQLLAYAICSFTSVYDWMDCRCIGRRDLLLYRLQLHYCKLYY